MNKTALILILVYMLTGCAGVGEISSSGEDSVGPYPDNWKSIAVAYIKTSYFDPYSVRDSEAAPPFRNRKAFYDTWTLCIRNNAKNRLGGYTGLRTTAIGIKKGQIDQVNDYDCKNRNLNYQPLPIN